MRLVLATNNPGKLAEFRRLLHGSGFEAIFPADLGIHLDVPETAETYAENAAAKATAFARAARCLALADDSGLEVDALDGRPGPRSARHGGEGLTETDRVALLLRELEGVPPAQRTARFRAVAAIATPQGDVHLFEGVLEGAIALAPRGSGGFGYDPIFLVDGSRTAGELPPDEKDATSHRGQAVRAALAWLRAEKDSLHGYLS
jgi:XTP/dITP diphosphohydrolase